uniref:Uncharacterized protein n=1 Tax=Siphoviridae sp. ctg6c78 TaxID=2825603 RepID=A0A8S5URP4_9CAUD|nr:MAG TPA: hypothetical protein [Siphoviridae sp. ctg6c78]DAT63962.1 MAG TPA: hypothetical protein [Caudoviricetes sp.]
MTYISVSGAGSSLNGLITVDPLSALSFHSYMRTSRLLHILPNYIARPFSLSR